MMSCVYRGKVYMNYKFCKHNETFSIIRFDIRLLTFAKFLEFLKSSTVKVGLKIFSYFPAWRYV